MHCGAVPSPHSRFKDRGRRVEGDRFRRQAFEEAAASKIVQEHQELGFVCRSGCVYHEEGDEV